MDNWITFEGQITPMVWGDSIFTVLPIPDDIANDLRSRNAKRIEVELNDTPYNLALTKAPVIDHTFVYTGKSVLKETGIEPGDMIDVRLRIANPDMVEEPRDVLAALRESEAITQWERLTPGKKRGHLHQINSAKREATRKDRIRKLIVTLKQS